MGSFMSSLPRFVVPLIALLCLLLIAGCASEKPAVTSAGTAASTKNTDPKQIVEKTAKPDEPPEAAVSKPADEGPVIVMTQKGVTLNWKEKGQIRMSAKARAAEADEVTKTGTLLDFSANLYENGKLTATISAPKAVADTVNRVVTATGGVTLKSVERQTVVNAQWVKWYSRQQKVIGNGGVKITSPQWNLEGAAFVADTNMKTLSIRNSAKGLVTE